MGASADTVVDHGGGGGGSCKQTSQSDVDVQNCVGEVSTNEYFLMSHSHDIIPRHAHDIKENWEI